MMIKIKSIFLMPLVVFFVASCAADKNSSKAQSATNGSNGSTSKDSLCSTLTAHAIARDASYSDLITQFCGQNALSLLRAAPYYYRGNGVPEVKTDATPAGNSSHMRLLASFVSPTDPKSYFNMMRLELDKPDNFDDIFEYDKNITYKRLSGNGQATSYSYLNNKEDVAVQYEATSFFIEVAANQTYIVTSKVDKAISIVQNFRGVLIINKTGEGTELFSLADQTYDNRGDHAGMVSKAQQNFQSNLAMAFRNSLKATQANSFFP